MNEKIFIITQKVEPYRLKFYELLNTKLNGQLISVHSNKINTPHGFQSFYSKKYTFLRFHFQTGYWKEIFEKKPAVIVAEFDLHVISNILLLFLCKILNINFIWWGIGLGKNKWLYIIRKLLIRASNGIIVYEESSKSNLIKLGVKNEKIHVMKNTIYVPNPEFNENFEDKKNLLVIGKLDKRKGIHSLLISFSEIYSQLKTIKQIIIIGEGPEKENLMKLSSDLGISQAVTFKGEILDESILRKEFHKSLATIHPSQAGLSVLHSFAYGVPFITSKRAVSGGEANNIISEFNGIIFDNKTSLPSIIMNIDSKPEKFHQMGLNAFNYYNNERRMDKMVNNYFNAILKLSKL